MFYFCVQGICISEQLLEHIAASLGQPPETIRLLNMYALMHTPNKHFKRGEGVDTLSWERRKGGEAISYEYKHTQK